MAQKKMIHIVADDREVNSATIKILRALPDVEVTVRRLKLGDYQVDESIVFERKTLMDFTASIKDGRLFKQVCRLVSSPLRSAIILEGTSRELASSNMRREAIQGALIMVSVVLGVPVLRSKGTNETAHLMMYAAKQIHSVKVGAFYRHGKRPKGKRRLQLYILQGFPSVGPTRAARLLDAFGSIENICTAPVEKLDEVDGVGIHTAKFIHWAAS